MQEKSNQVKLTKVAYERNWHSYIFQVKFSLMLGLA